MGKRKNMQRKLVRNATGSLCFSLTTMAMSILILSGCQSGFNSNLPPSQVRPVQWPGVTVPKYTPHSAQPDFTPNSQFPYQWLPMRNYEDFNRWKGIIIHHSAGDFGDAATFDREHKEQGWDGLGYHFVINNGKNTRNIRDGVVQVGQRWQQQTTGAHCRVDPSDSNYWNEHTIGICLVGNFENHRPTEAQWQSLVKLVRFLLQRYHIPVDKIKCHRDIKPTECPGKNFSLNELKQRMIY